MNLKRVTSGLFTGSWSGLFGPDGWQGNVKKEREKKQKENYLVW